PEIAALVIRGPGPVVVALAPDDDPWVTAQDAADDAARQQRRPTPAAAPEGTRGPFRVERKRGGTHVPSQHTALPGSGSGRSVPAAGRGDHQREPRPRRAEPRPPPRTHRSRSPLPGAGALAADLDLAVARWPRRGAAPPPWAGVGSTGWCARRVRLGCGPSRGPGCALPPRRRRSRVARPSAHCLPMAGP